MSTRNFQACHRKVYGQCLFHRYRELLIRDLPNPQTKWSNKGGTDILYIWEIHSWTSRNFLISMLYGNKVGRIFHVQRVSAENTMIPTGKEYGLRVTTPIKRWVISKKGFKSKFKKIAMGFWDLPFGFMENPSETKHSLWTAQSCSNPTVFSRSRHKKRSAWIFFVEKTAIIPRKLQHAPGAHPLQCPYPTVKEFPLKPVGTGLGVCSNGVLQQP